MPSRGSTPWTRQWTCRRSGCTRCGAARSPVSPSCPTRPAAVPLSVNDGPLLREWFDHRFAEFVQRFRCGEVSEPDVEPLNALTGQITEMSGQFVGIATNKA